MSPTSMTTTPVPAQEVSLPTIVVNHMLEPPGRVTGITRFLFALLQSLVDHDRHQVVLVTAWPTSQLPAALTQSRLIVVSVPHHGKLSVNVAMQGRVLSRVMQAHAPAIEFNANPLGYFAGNWPRIITVHDLYLKLMPNAYLRRHRWTWSLLFPLSARNADAIIVPSDSTCQDLGRFYPALTRKTIVIPEAPAFNFSLPETGPPIDGRYGMINGNISPNKNVAVVVEALALLEYEGLTVPIVHVGRDEMGVLAAAQRRTRLRQPIVSLPGISDGELRGAYKNAAFFLNTSLHEGFCLPIVEAQHCGTPVIASNRSALPEVAGAGALFVDPTSAQAVAAAIKTVWTDADTASALSRLGTANVARFSWDRAAAQLVSVCDSVMAARKPQSRPTSGHKPRKSDWLA